MVMTPNREPNVFGAISHPARRGMLNLHVEADCPVNVIAGHFEMSRPAVSQHRRVLLDAGLVTEQRFAASAAIASSPRCSALCGTGSLTMSGSGMTAFSGFRSI